MVTETPMDSSSETIRSRFLIAASLIAATLASLCCILPIVFILTGISLLGASALFAAWRPYLLVMTFGCLGVGFYYAYRPLKDECAPGSVCATPQSRRPMRIALWVATIAALILAAFPYFSEAVAEFLLSHRS